MALFLAPLLQLYRIMFLADAAKGYNLFQVRSKTYTVANRGANLVFLSHFVKAIDKFQARDGGETK